LLKMRVFLAAVGAWAVQALVVPKDQKKQVVEVPKAAAPATVAKRELPTLATSLAVLSHSKSSRQDPPPAETVSPEVNAEEYEKDWGTEHRSEPYPESSRGLEHHPSYNSTTRIERYFGLAWYYLLAIVALVGAAAYAAFGYFKK